MDQPRKPKAGNAEPSANWRALLTEDLLVRNSLGEAHNSHFVILASLLVNRGAAITAENGPESRSAAALSYRNATH
jgi:hypothetical protein